MHKTLSYYENNAKYLSQRYEFANVDNIHTLLLKTFPSKSYLLEIGCGSGLCMERVRCCEKYGLQLEYSEITADGLDHDGVVWLTCASSPF